MKRIIAVTTILLVLAFSSIASAASLVLTNHTGVDIHNLYFSPARENHWGSDILENHVLRAGDSTTIAWSDSEGHAWDIMVKDSDGNALYWQNLQLKDVTQILLDPSGTAHLK